MPHRRKRGGQPKNQNARKHGFYAAALGPKARNILRRALALDPEELDQEIALLRTAMFLLMENDPSNINTLTLAASVLVRMVALEHRLTPEEEHDLHESFVRLLRDLAPQPAPLTQPAATP